MPVLETYRYATVLINGGRDNLTQFAIELRKAGYQVGRPNAGVMCVDDVSEEELHHLTEASIRRGCYVESTRGIRTVERNLTVKKAEKTDLQEKTWYFSEALEDSHPFVFVRSLTKQVVPRIAAEESDDSDDEDEGDIDAQEEVIVVDMDLVDAAGHIPRRHSADAREVKEYGLRLATEEDFEERDLPVPAEVKLLTTREAASKGPDKRALANFGLEL